MGSHISIIAAIDVDEYMHMRKTILSISLAALILMGCAKQGTQEPPAIETDNPQPTTATSETPTPKTTATGTEMVITITPAAAVKLTPMPSNTPILSQVSTLSVEEENNLLLSLMHSNDGCDLPCIWGISPNPAGNGNLTTLLSGLTYAEIEDVLLIRVSEYAHSGGITWLFMGEINQLSADFSYYFNNQAIEQITLFLRTQGIESDSQSLGQGIPEFQLFTQQYSLATVLAKNGTPAPQRSLLPPFDHAPRINHC